MWETVIGLEVHVQLNTRSKMFCSCSAAFGDKPNTNICPICLGLPGALPLPNARAVRLGVRTALALDCEIHNVSVFERKSYFYPDLPKGYQISQYGKPLATSGSLPIESESGARRIGIGRLHLEEDAGKSLHDRVPNRTAVDFNRCGVPLAEIVSEPVVRSPEEARAFLLSLKQLLTYLSVSDCSMEQGSLRVDANLSVRRSGEKLGTKQELKNLNSFAAVVRGLSLLRDHQIDRLEKGRSVAQQTFMLDAGALRVMRTKEESHDYRYFPDPDLPPLVLNAAGIDVEKERAALPELPWARRARFEDKIGLSSYSAQVITSTPELADYFEAVVARNMDSVEASNWIMDSVLADANEHGGRFRVSPEMLADLITMVLEGRLSRRAAKQVFAVIARTNEAPIAAAERLGLLQVSDPEQLAALVDSVLSSWPGQVVRYRGGEERLLGYLIGQVMKASQGSANPKAVRALLKERLRGSGP